MIGLFYLFYDWPVDMQIWGLLTRGQCRVSDTQVNVKAHDRPFVSVAVILNEYTDDRTAKSKI